LGLPCILFYQVKGSTNHKKDTKDTRDTCHFGVLTESLRNSSKSNHLDLRSDLGGFAWLVTWGGLLSSPHSSPQMACILCIVLRCPWVFRVSFFIK
jgi:hypothetical protein